MRDRRRFDPREAKAMAKEQQLTNEKLDSQGLCRCCGEAPKNPHINAKVCLDCYKSLGQAGCSVHKCPNSSTRVFRGYEYCNAHLADQVKEVYHRYLDHKHLVNELKAELNKKAEELNYDPRKSHNRVKGLSDEESKLFDKHAKIKRMEVTMDDLKRDIKQVVDSDIDVFPDNYELFG